MKLSEIEHIFFDLDHTLWDFERNSALAFQEVFQKQRVEIALTDFLEAYKPINFRYWELYRNNSVTKEALRYGRLKESFDTLKFEASDDLIHLLAEDYIHHLPNNNYLLENTLEILEYLKPNYNLHIITNGFEEVQGKKLLNSGINDFFLTTTTSEDAGVKKPHPDIFEKALSKSGAIAEKSVMIGDSFEADIIGASKFGLNVIYLDVEGQRIQDQFLQIANLNELRKYL